MTNPLATRKLFLILPAILLLASIVFSNSLRNGFVNWDDPVNVQENIYIRDITTHNIKAWFTRPLIGMYTPLVYLSYALDYRVAGLNPWMYHLSNLLLHLINISLVFFLVRLFTGKLEIAGIASLLFAIHPLNAAAVIPVSVRSSVLYAVFYLSAYLCYLQYLKNGLRVRYLVAAFALFVLSLLSKSAAVVLPLLMVLTDWYFKRKFDWPAIREKIPFFLLSLIFGIITIVVRINVGHFEGLYIYNTFERMLLASYSIAFYISKLLLPFNLSAYYDYPDNTAGDLPAAFYLSPFMILLLVYALYKAKRYKRELLFCSSFFFIHIFLVLKIVPMGREMVCSRYAYLPGLGLFSMVGGAYAFTKSRLSSTNSRRLGAAEGAYRFAGKIKTALTVLLILCTGAFSFISFQRNGTWKDSFTLWGEIIKNYPKKYITYNKRGLEKEKLKDYAGAVQEFKKAIELNPGYMNAYNNRGRAEMELKDYAGAIQDFNKAIELNSSYTDAYNNRGFAEMELKDYAGAMQDFSKTIELNPDYMYAYNNRGIVKVALKDYAGAVRDFNKAIELNSSYTDAYNNRGIAERLLRGHTGFEKANELKGIESVFPTWSSTGCGERI
jgi:tetratricopeptide (TPR) repeat protein